MNTFWLHLLWFWMLYSRLRLRFVPRECIGPKFLCLKTNILVILPALLCQLSQWAVSATGKRFTTRAPSWFTCQRTSAHLPMKRALVSFTYIMGAHVLWAKKHLFQLLWVATFLHPHNCPKVVLHLGTAAPTNLIWIQDSSCCLHVRSWGILKLSTHTE